LILCHRSVILLQLQQRRLMLHTVLVFVGSIFNELSDFSKADLLVDRFSGREEAVAPPPREPLHLSQNEPIVRKNVPDHRLSTWWEKGFSVAELDVSSVPDSWVAADGLQGHFFSSHQGAFSSLTALRKK